MSVLASRTTSLVARRASGPLRAMVPASSTAASTTSAAGTTRFTSPISYARWAEMYSPVRVSSRARANGMRLLRNTPPPAAHSARFTSGRPSLASSATTARSQFSRSSKPPATAVA